MVGVRLKWTVLNAKGSLVGNVKKPDIILSQDELYPLRRVIKILSFYVLSVIQSSKNLSLKEKSEFLKDTSGCTEAHLKSSYGGKPDKDEPPTISPAPHRKMGERLVPLTLRLGAGDINYEKIIHTN